MKEIAIHKNDIIRIYSLEEINKKYVTEAELILMQFLMQREEETINNEVKL